MGHADPHPDQQHHFEVQSKFPVNLPSGSYVEGSSRFGGIQPDYYLDFESSEFAEIRKAAQELKAGNLDNWEKVKALNKIIRSNLLPNGAYNDPNYRSLLTDYREQGTDVPLSKYVCTQAGVCRENALILHYALKEAGVPNEFAYAKVQAIGMGINKTEDHAFIVFKHLNDKWIADSYNSWFNGYRLEDLLSEKGVGLDGQSLPGAEKKDVQRRIVNFNDYPRVWVKKTDVNLPGPRPLVTKEVSLRESRASCFKNALKKLFQSNSPGRSVN